MGNEHEGLARRITLAQRQDIPDEILNPVGVYPFRLGRAEVAALVGGHAMVRAGKSRQDLVPGAGVFGKAVQKQDERRARVAFSADRDVDAVGGYCFVPHVVAFG